ncbi:hypothetical protein [Psychrobacillus sp. NPDC096623]|uniref:hypothetical protein n=1 Tax=Psychrobacillus sp. NPDC096623 TaxID=3364492 RepID=UPI003824DCBA
MIKQLLSILIISCFILTACGSQRDSNEPANPETQIDNQDQKIPNTGNEQVNEENDVGIPKMDDFNDPTIEKPE